MHNGSGLLKLYRYFRLRIVRFFKRLFRRISHLQMFTKVLIFIATLFFFFLWYGSAYLTDLVYDRELRTLLNPGVFHHLIFWPSLVIVIVFLLSIKLLVDLISRKPGTVIRSRLLIIFLLVTVLPSLIYIFIINRVLSETMNLFFQPKLGKALNDTLDIFKENSKRRVEEGQLSLSQIAEDAQKWLNQEYNISDEEGYLIQAFESSRLSGLAYVNLAEQEKFFIHRNVPEVRPLMTRFPFRKKLNQESKVFSEYNLDYDYVWVSRLVEYNSEPAGYLVGITLMSGELSSRVSETISVIRNLKQFEILKDTLRQATFVLYLYFYIPILLLGFLLFWLFSMSIVRPLNKLALATQMVGRGDFSVKINYSRKDEIGELIRNFVRMNEELRESKSSLKSLSRVEAWREVAIRLAHELKNPLTPISLATEQIESHLQRNHFETYEKTVESFNLIRSEIKHIQTLVKDFSAFSREVVLDKEKIFLTDLVIDIQDQMNPYRENVSVIYKNSGDLERGLLVDRKKIKQVFSNLILNAIEAHRQAKTEEPRISLRTNIYTDRESKTWVAFQFADNGPGVSEEHEQKLFEPYFTTKKEGTGLGLSITQVFIQAHGGQLNYKREEDETVFEVCLPLSEEEVRDNA